MSLDATTFNDQIRRWQTAEPGELAQNFHSLQNNPTGTKGASSINYQFVKASSFTVTDLAGLQAISQDIQTMKIWMTMTEFEKDKISFEPIIEVTYKDKTGVSGSATFGTSSNFLVLANTQRIPPAFVKNTTQLWNELESENLPDMFNTRNSLGGAERVHFYNVDGTGLESIKTLLTDATSMSILPGIDLNKSIDSGDTLFIPIISIQAPTVGIITTANIQNNHLHGVSWSVFDDGDDDIYFDFSNPCPPFCSDPPGLSLT